MSYTIERTIVQKCPNPTCTNTYVNAITRKEMPGMDARYRIVCEKCGFSTGWFNTFHELMAWHHYYAKHDCYKK